MGFGIAINQFSCLNLGNFNQKQTEHLAGKLIGGIHGFQLRYFRSLIQSSHSKPTGLSPGQGHGNVDSGMGGGGLQIASTFILKIKGRRENLCSKKLSVALCKA